MHSRPWWMSIETHFHWSYVVRFVRATRFSSHKFQFWHISKKKNSTRKWKSFFFRFSFLLLLHLPRIIVMKKFAIMNFHSFFSLVWLSPSGEWVSWFQTIFFLFYLYLFCSILYLSFMCLTNNKTKNEISLKWMLSVSLLSILLILLSLLLPNVFITKRDERMSRKKETHQ